MGVVKNFEKAILLCEGDYIATSDQDDVWLERKIEVLYSKIKKFSEPSLVYSDYTIVDKNLKVIQMLERKKEKLKFTSPRPPLSHAFQNFVTGCTMMFNRSLVNRALLFVMAYTCTTGGCLLLPIFMGHLFMFQISWFCIGSIIVT